jgi:hypothetical protein
MRDIADSVWQDLDDQKRARLKRLGITSLDIANINQAKMLPALLVLGYPANPHMIKWAFIRREIKPVRLGLGNYVSLRDIIEWVESRRQDGIYRAPADAGSRP